MAFPSNAAPMNFFSAGSPFLSHPLLTAERTVAEVNAIEAILQLDPGDRVLDIGCGFGRHSAELSSRGFPTTGVDPSAAMITEANNRWQQSCRTEPAKAEPSQTKHGQTEHSKLANGTLPTFVIGTADDVVIDQPFDGAICLFTTLGQVNSDGSDNVDLACRVAGLIGPNKRAVFEVPNKPWVITNLANHDHFATKDGSTTITRSYHADTSRVVEEFVVVSNDQPATFNLSYRIFTDNELQALLVSSGFASVTLFSSLQSAASGSERSSRSEDDETIVAVAAVQGGSA